MSKPTSDTSSALIAALDGLSNSRTGPGNAVDKLLSLVDNADVHAAFVRALTDKTALDTYRVSAGKLAEVSEDLPFAVSEESIRRWRRSHARESSKQA